MNEEFAVHESSQIAIYLESQGIECQMYGRTQVCAVVTDSREAAVDTLFVARKGEQHDGHDYIPAALERGCRSFLVARDWYTQNSAEWKSDEKLFFLVVAVSPEAALFAWARAYRQYLRAFVLAISGSYGKTSTKELLRGMLVQHYRCRATVGNRNAPVGCALTLLSLPVATEVVVLELGIDHPGEMDLLCSLARPNACLLTGIGSAHLGGFGTQRTLAEEKARIYAGLVPYWPAKPQGLAAVPDLAPLIGRAFAFLPADDAYLPVLEKAVPPGSEVHYYSAALARESGHRVEDRGLAGLRFFYGGEVSDLPLLGKHSQQGFWAAASFAQSVGLEAAEIAAGARQYRPLFGRGELLRRVLPDGLPVLLLQDCYNASPESLFALLEMLADWWQHGLLPPCVLVLADMLELGGQSRTKHEGVAELLWELFPERGRRWIGADWENRGLRVLLCGTEMRHAWQRLQILQAEKSGEGQGKTQGAERESEGMTKIMLDSMWVHYQNRAEALERAIVQELSELAERTRLAGQTQVLLVLKGSRSMHLEKIAEKILR